VPDLVPVDAVPDPVCWLGLDHKVALTDDVVSPVVFEIETDTGVGTVAGVDVAEVFDELCVLEAPPLIVGCTVPPLIDGWTFIVGSTVISG
jgi:hypothetical protein